jgi:hypothetical protein
MNDGDDLMTDRELEAELRRRAQRASLPPDWTRSQLLPAVHRAVDLTPQRVPSSRSAPLGALVAVGALLLLIVVALPRLVSGPIASREPSPTTVPSESAGPVVLSTQDFATRLAAGELDGRTVIVDGRISPDELRRDLCGLGEQCFLGTLDGTDPPADIFSRHQPTVQGRVTRFGEAESGWPWWYRAEAPIEGLLLMSVDRRGSVEFRGTVLSSASGDVWALAAVAAIDIDQVVQSEALIVDGWIDQHGDAPRCPRPPESAQADGLPSMWCRPPVWLADAPASEADAEEGPPGAVLLGGDPLYLLSGDARRQPVQGRFVIAPRLYGGGCPAGEPPCWYWELIAVLSVTQMGPLPSDAATPATPTPAATPQSAPARVVCDYVYTVLDSTGLVSDCRADEGWMGWGINPQDDLTRVVASWEGSSCADRVELEFDRLGDDYSLVASEGAEPTGCEGTSVRRGVLLELRQAVPADSVHFTERWLIGPRPTPYPTGVVAWWALSPTERPTAESTTLDVEVYEFACAGGRSPEGRVLPPTITYAAASITITFSVQPLRGEGDCPTAPGVPYHVELGQQLGDRRLVDGGFRLLGEDRQPDDVVIEHGDMLVLSSSRVDDMARERLLAMAGPDACLDIPRVTIDRYVPTAEDLEREADKVGPAGGPVFEGNAYLGTWIEAARYFGAIEAYAGRPKPWYIIAPGSAFPWADLPEDKPVLASLDPFPVSDGRTIWWPAFHNAPVWATTNCPTQ